jgi:hypothetical protein
MLYFLIFLCNSINTSQGTDTTASTQDEKLTDDRMGDHSPTKKVTFDEASHIGIVLVFSFFKFSSKI